MRKLPTNLKVFLISTYVITVISLFFFLFRDMPGAVLASYINIIFFGVLTIFTETFTVSYKNISFSTSFALTIACYFLFGAFSTIIITILGFTFRVLKVDGKYKHIFNTPFYGTVFNYCVLMLPIIYGDYFYTILGGKNSSNNISDNIIYIILFSIIAFIVNTIIISALYSISSRKNFLYSFVENIRLGVLNTLAMAPLGIILAIIFNEFGYLGVLLTLFPIVLARYTFSLYIDSKSKFVQTVDALMRAMEARDKYTEGHSQRVADLAKSIAKELGYNEWRIEQLNIASLLHDVGKIGIDDNILNKPGKLTAEEFDIIKKHPEIGYNILKDIKGLEYIISIARYHHERYDGKGYPSGKSADELNLDVFIVQLADAVDAMATDRPYRKALQENVILEEVKKYSGTQFHPKVVEAYLHIVEKHKKVV